MAVNQDDYIADSLRDAVDIAEITKNKLAGGFLTAIDNLVNLSANSTNDQVRIAASWRVVRLAMELGAVELSPVWEFWHRVVKESRRDGSDDDE